MSITKRLTKGSPLTFAELDANFTELSPRISTVTANTTLDATYYTVLADAAEGSLVITLPSAASAFSAGVGRIYNIKKVDSSANTVTVDGDGDETLDGEATLVLDEQYQSVTIQSNGSSWSLL